MAIYCIILSAQHKCLCQWQLGLRKAAPDRQTKHQWKLLIPKCAQHSSYSSGLLYDAVCVSVCMCVCVYSLVFVCTFPVLTGWSAAVLESVLTESMGSAGYFYPLACVREQVEALWATTRSHSDEWRYAVIADCFGQMLKIECLPPSLMERHCMWQE